MPKSSSRLTINIIQIATFQLRVTYDYLDENDIVTTSMNFDHYINKFKRNQKLDRSSLSLDPLFPPANRDRYACRLFGQTKEACIIE